MNLDPVRVKLLGVWSIMSTNHRYLMEDDNEVYGYYSEWAAEARAEADAIDDQARWDADDDLMEWEAQQADPLRAQCDFGWDDRKCCEDTAEDRIWF